MKQITLNLDGTLNILDTTKYYALHMPYIYGNIIFILERIMSSTGNYALIENKSRIVVCASDCLQHTCKKALLFKITTLRESYKGTLWQFDTKKELDKFCV